MFQQLSASHTREILCKCLSPRRVRGTFVRRPAYLFCTQWSRIRQTMGAQSNARSATNRVPLYASNHHLLRGLRNCHPCRRGSVHSCRSLHAQSSHTRHGPQSFLCLCGKVLPDHQSIGLDCLQLGLLQASPQRSGSFQGSSHLGRLLAPFRNSCGLRRLRPHQKSDFFKRPRLLHRPVPVDLPHLSRHPRQSDSLRHLALKTRDRNLAIYATQGRTGGVWCSHETHSYGLTQELFKRTFLSTAFSGNS